MSDLRFYSLQVPKLVSAAVSTAGAVLVHGKSKHCLDDVAAVSAAGPGDITFIRDLKNLKTINRLTAGLCFCTPDVADTVILMGAHAVAVCEMPDIAFMKAAKALVKPRQSLDLAGAVSPDAKLAKGVKIGIGACIGPGADIGEDTTIGPGAVVGAGCVLGRNCQIGANAVIGFTVMGDHVDIRPGAVLGEAGLGVITGKGRNVAMAHFGRVRIANGVRIGANSTVDRAVFGETVIGARSQLDNLVHIAHNVHIGMDCVLASFCGVSGSSVLGNGVMMGGRVGIIDHITVEDGAHLGAGAVVTKNVGAGEVWAGHPARPLRRYLREQIVLRKMIEKQGAPHDRD